MTKLASKNHIYSLIKKLQSHGYETYIVGGAVRDMLLHRTPKDWDIVSSASPKQIKRIFQRQAIIIGRRFKLVHIRFGREIVEVSTFRSAPDKRKQLHKKRKRKLPENMIFRDNEFGTSYEDAWRRDFTVNALFYDPVSEKIIDFTEMGMDDLNNRTVRAIGKAEMRFEEDPVRIIRAVKLAGQYNFQIEKETNQALKNNIHLLKHVTQSRINLEFEKICNNLYSDKILANFAEFQILQYILPNIYKNQNTENLKSIFQLISERNKRVINGKYRESLSVFFACLIFPFLKTEFDSVKSDNSDSLQNLRIIISKTAKEILYPRQLPKRVISACKKNILIAYALLNSQHIPENSRKRYYHNALEFVKIYSKFNELENSKNSSVSH